MCTHLQLSVLFSALSYPQLHAVLLDETEIRRIDLALEHLFAVDVHVDEVVGKGHGQTMPLVVCDLYRKRLNMRPLAVDVVHFEFVPVPIAFEFKKSEKYRKNVYICTAPKNCIPQIAS